MNQSRKYDFNRRPHPLHVETAPLQREESGGQRGEACLLLESSWRSRSYSTKSLRAKISKTGVIIILLQNCKNLMFIVCYVPDARWAFFFFFNSYKLTREVVVLFYKWKKLRLRDG